MPKCRECNAEVVFVLTKNNIKMPVDAETYHGEKVFDHTIHRSHFATCTEPDKFRKDKFQQISSPPLTATEKQQRVITDEQ